MLRRALFARLACLTHPGPDRLMRLAVLRHLARLAVAMLAAVALLGGPAPATAQTPPVVTDIGGRPVRLVVAAGQCVLERAQQADRAILDLVTRALGGQNELLLHTAECANLAAVRAGRTPYLDSFTQAQVLIQLREQDFSGRETAIVREVCTYMRTQAEALQKEVGPKIEQRIRDLAVGIGVNEQKPLGVIGEDERACYSGTLLGLSTPQGDKRLILSIFAVTVLNGRIVYLYRFQANPDDAARDTLLALVKTAVIDHAAANVPPGAPAKTK